VLRVKGLGFKGFGVRVTMKCLCRVLHSADRRPALESKSRVVRRKLEFRREEVNMKVNRLD